jgi:pyrroline-5-carboxylate reductase
MPNTAAALCESMTCLSSLSQFTQGLKTAQSLFENVGKTLVIDETQMASATALCACGVAFFLRAIRAASQGGIEIGFHSDEAFTISAQTARGAATLLLDNDTHPEAEIDLVTTPMGATIAGLNEMEHQGFSSAMIKGITTSTEKVTGLFKKD